MDDVGAERGERIEQRGDPAFAIEMAMPGEVERIRGRGEGRSRRSAQRDEQGGDAQPRQGRGQAQGHALGSALLEAGDDLGHPQLGAVVDVEGGVAHDARPARHERRFQRDVEGRARGQALSHRPRQRRLQEHAGERRQR